MTGTEPRRETLPSCHALSACRSPPTRLSVRSPTGRTRTRTAACRPTSGSSSSATRCSSLVVTDTLFNGHPDLPEGQLAKLRAAVVQMNALAEVARELQLGSFVRLGRGEEGTGGRDKPSILADTLEAVIGATYIDCGLDAASALVHRLFDPVIERSALLGAGLDWKTSLQELTAVPGPWRARVRGQGQRSRPPEAVPRRGARWAAGNSARAKAARRRPRSSWPPRPRTARSPPRAIEHAPTTGSPGPARDASDPGRAYAAPRRRHSTADPAPTARCRRRRA